MKGVQEFIAWLSEQNDVVQVVVVGGGFLLLIVFARAASRWLVGK